MVVTVSYTHLDVYKRQVTISITAAVSIMEVDSAFTKPSKVNS